MLFIGLPIAKQSIRSNAGHKYHCCQVVLIELKQKSGIIKNLEIYNKEVMKN